MRKSKTSIKVPKMDLCQTPGYGVEPLVEGLGGLTGLNVWEPAVGEGYLAAELFKYGCHVHGTDIDTGDDFLIGTKIPERTDAIVTNPPFSLKKEFTERALEFRMGFDTKVALLMQTEVVSTKWFYDLLTEFGNCGIIWFNPRINFKMPEKGWAGSGSHFSTAWYTWGWFEGNRFLRMEHWNKQYRQQFEY